MRLLAILFLVAFSTGLAEGIKSLVFPAETNNSYVEMVPLKPLNLRAFTLCMRVATELSGEREIILFAYRTRNHDELNVWRELDGRLLLYMSLEGVIFQTPETISGLETHLCITWDSSSGAASIFMDGKKSLAKIFKQGHNVLAGGKVILGQDPDSYLGNFYAQQSFVGEIGDVNMWDSVLPNSMIRDLASGKRVTSGNVLDWETTELSAFGNVHIIDREL